MGKELIRLHEEAMRKTMEFEHWMNTMERELVAITGPLYNEVARKIASGTPIICFERGVNSLHEPRHEAVENTRVWVRKLTGGIWRAAWFAKALHLRG